MTKTIKSIFLLSILLFAFLESASSSGLRALQNTETSFNLEETDNPATTKDTSDSFELGGGSPSDPKNEPTDNAANYDLGDADASQAPAPTTSTVVGASVKRVSEVPDDATSFVLGDEDDTQTVSNTQTNAGTTSESHEFDLGEEDSVGVSTSTSAGETSFDLDEGDHSASVGTSTSAGETSFDLNDDDTVGASASAGMASFDLSEDEGDHSASPSSSTPTSAGETSFDLQEDAPSGDALGASHEASDPETSFELTNEDQTNNVDLSDPADSSSSTDKTGANPGGRALSSNESVTVTASAKSGISLQTGILMSLVAIVSALVL